MNPIAKVDQGFEQVLEWIRRRPLPWLLSLRIGALGKKVGQWTILLFFNCCIRPTDLTGESRIELPFGIFYALAPASLYALASVQMFKSFMPVIAPPSTDSPFDRAILMWGMPYIMHGAAFLLILSLTYVLGVMRWAYSKIFCALLGPVRSKVERASLAYFLLKSCSTMFIFSLFAWIVAHLVTLDQNTAASLATWGEQIGPFLSIHSGYSIFLLGATALGFAGFEMCRVNGRAAMREIYVADATSEQVEDVKLLILVTLFALLAFAPRLTGLVH